MTTLRHAAVPALLFASLILGGASNAGFAANLALQLAALPLLVWAIANGSASPVERPGRLLIVLFATMVVIVAVQLVPLPPGVWSSLPGRPSVAEGYGLLGIPLPWRPISLAPESSLASLLWLLPAFAVLMGTIRLGAFRASWLAWAIVIATTANVFVGALQILGGDSSAWYFYAVTNIGRAVGFFANSNHTATLLVVTIPFVAALRAASIARRKDTKHVSAIIVITLAALAVIAVGLMLNTSLAGIGLAIPASIASFLLTARNGRWLRIGAVAVGAMAMAAAAAIVIGPFDSNLGARSGASQEMAQLTRGVTIVRTLDASVDHMPLGSGLGSFRGVYQMMEDPNVVGTTYVNHAHSDVAEVVLELGIPGVLLMLGLVLWWGARTAALWRDPHPDYFARAAAIAVGVIMAHSLVDYPLRTAAIAAVFAACLGLMAGARQHVRASAISDARHLGVT